MSIRLQNRGPPPLAKSFTEGGSPHGAELLLAGIAAEASTVLPVIHAARSCTAPSHGYRSRSPPAPSEACRAAPEGAVGVVSTSGRGTETPSSPGPAADRPQRPSSRAAGESGGTPEARRSWRLSQKAAARPEVPEHEVQRRKRRSYTPEEILEFQQQAQCRVLERRRAMTAEPRVRKISDHSRRQSLDSFQRRTEMRLEEHTRVALEAIAVEQEGRERRARTAEEVVAFQRRAKARLSDWRRVQTLEKQKAEEEEQRRRARQREESQAAVLLKERRRAEIYALNALLREQGQKKLELFMQGRLEGRDAVEDSSEADGAGSSDEEGEGGGAVPNTREFQHGV